MVTLHFSNSFHPSRTRIGAKFTKHFLLDTDGQCVDIEYESNAWLAIQAPIIKDPSECQV